MSGLPPEQTATDPPVIRLGGGPKPRIVPMVIVTDAYLAEYAEEKLGDIVNTCG
jgi:hypothetical protein